MTRVQQSDGSVQTYRAVRMRLHGTTLWVTSADRKGVLEIASGACWADREMERCFPYSLTLHQFGRTHQIGITHGTIYLNLTGAPQQLRHSSQRVPPNGVLMLVKTERGTYVTIEGTLDEVTP